MAALAFLSACLFFLHVVPRASAAEASPAPSGSIPESSLRVDGSVLSITVDGRKFRGASSLPAGEHVLELQYLDILEYAPKPPLLLLLDAIASEDPGYPDRQECLVPWTAEAGHRYVVETDIGNRANMRCWIRDEDTNATFAGIQPPTMAGAE